MGLFCVSTHFRTNDDQALATALDQQGVNRYHILPAKGGWTSLYEEQSSQQDEHRIRDLAGSLSSELNVDAISFLVHDSDIACYWLFDNGELQDHYNSCPDYFDETSQDGPPTPAGGKPEVLLRYCQAGTRREELAAALAEETLFAESVVEQVATMLGIDTERALADFGDHGANGPGGASEFDGGGNGSGGVPGGFSPSLDMASQLAELMGTSSRAGNADSREEALVKAAAEGDMDQIDHLVNEGVAINVEAPAPLPGGQPLAGLGQLFPRGIPEISMAALLAAVANSQHDAAERLLIAGADPNHLHPLFGSPLHTAIGAGDASLLQLLIDHGGDINARNTHGQTPLQVVAAGRATLERLAKAQQLMNSLGVKIPGLSGQLPVEQMLADAAMPTEGWDACEELLKSLGAQ